MSETSQASAQQAKGHRRRERRVLLLVLSFAVPLAVVILLCLPGAGPIFRVFIIPSGGMLPTFPIDSRVLVSRASYGYSRHSFDFFELPIQGRWPALMPQRGDIIVFRLPRDQRFFYAQRVVGLPGEKIQVVDGRLSINGKLVWREPASEMRGPARSGAKGAVDVYVERLPEGVSHRIIESAGDRGPYDNTPEFVVPESHLFVLGDNRDNSIDSREASPPNGVGFLPIELVIGRVIATF